MAFEVAPPTAEQPGITAGSAAEGPSSTNEIDRLLNEILNDPNVFSLIDASPTSSSSSAPSPPCYSPSPRQLEQEALASLGQQQQQQSHPERCCVAPETPSPCTPSSSTDDHHAFFPPSPLSLPSPSHHPHPTSLPIHPPSHPSSSSLSPHPSIQPLSTHHLLKNVEVSISSNFSDPFLRGSIGRLLSVLENGLARIFLYSLNQECRVPLSCVEFVRPKPRDVVRVIQGPLTGFTGWLIGSCGNLLHLQLMNETFAQVVVSNVAKVAVEIGTPVATPSSPHPLPSPTSPSVPSATSPVLSPTSLPNGQFPSFPSPSSYPHSPTGYISGFPGRAAPAYVHTPYPRQLRRPLSVCPNGATRTPLQVTDHIHRRRVAIQQQRDAAAQRRLQVFRGNALNASRNIQQLGTLGGGGGKTVRGEHDYKALVKYLERPTQDILEEVRGRKMMEYDFGSTGDGGELSSNCIQVPLICPLSQSRMTLPCRGVQCKHPQCFDAEAYIEYNKCVVRPKEKKCTAYKSLKQQLFKCPLCSKSLPFCHLYVDKTLLQILQDTDEDEIEFDKTGSWKPVERKSAEEVIDLTLEDEGHHSP